MKKKNKRKNEKNYIYLLLILAIITLFISFIITNKSIFKTDNITINIGDSIPSKEDYVKSKYLNKCKDINLASDINYYHRTNNLEIICNNIKHKITLYVKDIKAPIIENNEIICKSEENCDVKSLVKVNEDSKDNVDISIVGNYDLNKVGEYKVTIKATDKGSNTSEKKIILKVYDKMVDIFKTSKGYTAITKAGITTIDDLIIVNKSYSLPNGYVPDNLVKINRSTVIDYVKDAFDLMKKDLNKEGLDIEAGTCYRSYNFQKALYTTYVARDGQTMADTYSARPGFSEHQTGLAIDISPVNSTFTNTKEGIWVRNNAYKYGFIIRYPLGAEKYTGYNYESWHIRYVGKELASKLYKGDGDYISLEEYFGITSSYID